MNTADLSNDILLQPSLPQDIEQRFMQSGMDYSMASNGTKFVAPQPVQDSSQFDQQQNFLSGTDDVDFSDFQMDLSNNPQAEEMMQTSPFDINENDLSIMDTSGDLNWENWDQLVRQFGQDADVATRNAPGTTAGQYWAGPQWETSGGTNPRPGMGMGGGDWF